MNNIENKIKQVSKYIKNKDIVLDIKLINYENYNLYFRIDYIKKLNIFKISWIDLDLIKDNKIEKYLNIEHISLEVVEEICDLIERNNTFDYIEETNKNIVEFTTYYLTNNYHFIFNRYIPQNLSNISDIFIIIFNHLPRRLTEFLEELHAEIMHTKSIYEYQDNLNFDLFNDDLENIFNKTIIKRGKEYYKENKVTFLEKIEDKYYAIVKGNEEYLVVIKYDEDNMLTQLYCTCPCEFFCKHIASAILAIRAKYENKFYKVLAISKEDTLLDLANNKHYLSIGVEEEYIKIINKYGEIELVPLFDEESNLMWKVLEDSPNKKLYKEINNAIKKYK